MQIYFSANNREEVIQIPVVPYLDLIECETKDEEFETVNGVLLLIGKKGLRTFSFSSFFPNKSYSFISGNYKNGEHYKKFFEKWRDKNVPIRVIIIDKGKEMLNMACRYEFNVGIKDRAGDIPYSLSVKEYIFAKAKGFGKNG